jgi:hypothetical protein
LRAEPRSSRRFPLAYVSAGVAALFSVPLLGVVLNVFREGQGNWQDEQDGVSSRIVASRRAGWGQFSHCCIEARTIRRTVARWMLECAAMVASL